MLAQEFTAGSSPVDGRDNLHNLSSNAILAQESPCRMRPSSARPGSQLAAADSETRSSGGAAAALAAPGGWLHCREEEEGWGRGHDLISRGLLVSSLSPCLVE